MFKRRTGRVGREFVIAGNHPDFAFIFDAHLRRTENVSRRMKRDFHAIHQSRFAVRHRFEFGFVAEPYAAKVFRLLSESNNPDFRDNCDRRARA